MRKYRAILFDLDGTTLDTDLYIALNYLHLFKQFRPDFVPHLKELVGFSGPTLAEVFQVYFPNHDFDTLYKEFRQFALLYSNTYSKLYPHELEVLKKLKSAGYLLGIVTSKRREATFSNLQHFGMLDLFQTVCCLDEVENPKPAPDSVFLALNRLGIKPEEAIFIGDSHTDYLAGIAAKTDTAMVDFGLKRLREDIKPQYIFSNFLEIERTFIGENNNT